VQVREAMMALVKARGAAVAWRVGGVEHTIVVEAGGPIVEAARPAAGLGVAGFREAVDDLPTSTRKISPMTTTSVWWATWWRRPSTPHIPRRFQQLRWLQSLISGDGRNSIWFRTGDRFGVLNRIAYKAWCGAWKLGVT
jgi:hypothetical protein